jgi:hypothetical protein
VCDVESRCLADEVVKQRGLAHPGLTTEDEYGAVAFVHVIEQPAQSRGLALSTEEREWRNMTRRH